MAQRILNFHYSCIKYSPQIDYRFVLGRAPFVSRSLQSFRQVLQWLELPQIMGGNRRESTPIEEMPDIGEFALGDGGGAKEGPKYSLETNAKDGGSGHVKRHIAK